MISPTAAILSRSASTGVRKVLQNEGKVHFQQQRSKHWIQYRNKNPPKEYLDTFKIPLTIAGGIIWWWQSWRLLRDYRELLPVKLPKASDFTDEELGIPPLDYEES